MSKLNSEEAEILTAFDKDELTRVKGAKALIERHKQYANTTFQKDARINIRISSRDLRGIQKRALSEGIPYLTLIASILHKYAEGRMGEKT